MRRILAIVLLIAFGSPLAAPLFASTADSQSNLPACCRRNGAHHCALSMAMGADGSPGAKFTAPPCPMCPTAATPAAHQHLSFDAPAHFFAEAISHPAMRMQTEARARVALDRSRQKRGPPTANLS